MLISIIVPFYNCAQFLARTIDSILNQGLAQNEYELILVNDGSTDKSLEVCQKFAQKHPTISILSQFNQGVAAARNFGMKVARGDYIFFIDADDYLMPNSLKYIMQHDFLNDIDILIFSSVSIPNFDNNQVPKGNIEGIIDYELSGEDMLRKGIMNFFVWNQLYRTSFIRENHIFFKSMPINEDTLFNLEVYRTNPRIRRITSEIYRYILYPGNRQLTKIRNRKDSRIQAYTYLTIFSVLSNINDEKKNMSDGLKSIFVSQFIPFTTRLLASNISVKEFKDIKKSITKYNGIRPNDNQSNKYYFFACYILKYDFLFPIHKFLFQKLFLPFILPLFSRN